MKEMIYKSNRVSPIVLDCGEYIGYSWCVVSYGTHPCSYIGLPEDSVMNEELSDSVNCHGGVTYFEKDFPVSSKEIDSLKNRCGVLGYDYAHSCDYMGYFADEPFLGDSFHGTIKYTTEELVKEVKEVIEDIARNDNKARLNSNRSEIIEEIMESIHEEGLEQDILNLLTE
jgi:hypothetical protein